MSANTTGIREVDVYIATTGKQLQQTQDALASATEKINKKKILTGQQKIWKTA